MRDEFDLSNLGKKKVKRINSKRKVKLTFSPLKPEYNKEQMKGESEYSLPKLLLEEWSFAR